MKIEVFCKLTFIIHLIIAQGGFLFLVLYKYQSFVNSCKRAILLILFWILMNVICDGRPLTHIENHLTFSLYGQWPMPNYNFNESWVGQIFEYVK